MRALLSEYDILTARRRPFIGWRSRDFPVSGHRTFCNASLPICWGHFVFPPHALSDEIAVRLLAFGRRSLVLGVYISLSAPARASRSLAIGFPPSGSLSLLLGSSDIPWLFFSGYLISFPLIYHQLGYRSVGPIKPGPPGFRRGSTYS